MKFIMIFGPQASGKMTIGGKVADAFKLPLLYNHVTLDVVWPYIGWNDTTFKLSEQLRMGIFNHIADEENHPGIVFTFVWDFSNEQDREYVDSIRELFNQSHQKMYFVELEADIEERLARNETEYRLCKKPSKRNIEFSRQELLHSAENHRLNSNPGEVVAEHYLKIDVTHLTADESAAEIIDWIYALEQKID